MRLLLAVVVAVSLTSCTASAPPAKTPASDWSTYGAPITLEGAAPLDRVLAVAAAGQPVMIEGVIGDVCQSKGCWMTVRDANQEVRVEFKDYGFFVPSSAGGKPVRLEGVLTEKVMSPEDQEHIASESKEGGGVGTPSDAPKKLYVFVASGVAIEGGGELSAEQKERIGGAAEGGGDGHDHSEPGHKH